MRALEWTDEERAGILKVLTAIAEGYKVTSIDDRYIMVENPEYHYPWDEPNLLLDVYVLNGKEFPEEEIDSEEK